VKFRKIILGYYAVLFCGFGLAALVVPEQLANLMDNHLVSNLAKMEFMATYCGLFVGLGCFLFYCLVSDVKSGLVAVFFTMGMMFIFRAIGLLAFNVDNVVQYIYLVGELATILLVGFLLIDKRVSLRSPSEQL